MWETEIEGVKIESQYRPGVNTQLLEHDQHLAVASLRPQGRPVPEDDTMQFEWYVPKDEQSHHYIVTWGKRVKDARSSRAVLPRDGRRLEGHGRAQIQQ